MERGELEIRAAREAGYSEDAIFEQIKPEYMAALNAGYSRQKIDAYYGFPHAGPPGTDTDIEQAIIRAGVGVGGEGGTAGIPVNSIWRAFEHGKDAAIGFPVLPVGMLNRRDIPATQVDEESNLLHRIIAGGTTFALDIPWYTAGGAIGATAGGGPTPAGVILGTGNAFAFHGAVRKVLMDRYRNGEITDFDEFWERLTAAGIEAAKGEALGIAVGTIGVAGASAKIAPEFIAAGEIGAILKMGPAMEGRAGPSKDEIIETTILIGGMKAFGGFASKTSPTAKIMTVYEKLGILPRDIVKRAKESPSIIDDLNSSNIKIPRKLERQGREPLKEEEVAAYEARVDAAKEIAATKAEQKVIDTRLKREKATRELERRLSEAEAGGDPKEAAAARAAIKEVARVAEKERSLAEDAGKGGPMETDAQNTIMAQVGGRPPDEPSLFNWRQRLYQRGVDRYHPVGIAMDAARRVWAGEGRKMDITEDAYVQFRLLGGTVSRAEHILEIGSLRFADLKKNGKSMNEIFKDIGSNEAALDKFRAYAVSKRVIEKEAQGINTGFDLNAAKQVVRELKSPKMDERVAEAHAYNDRMLQYITDAGLLTVEATELIRAMNKDYIPWHRIKSKESKGPAVRASDLANPVMKMKGVRKPEPIQDPLSAMVTNTYEFVRMAEINAARRTYVDTMTEAGLTELAERVRNPVRVTKLSEKDQKRVIEKWLKNRDKELTAKEREEVNDAIDGTMDVFTSFSRKPNPGEFAVYRDGKRELWKAPPEIIEAIGKTTPEVQSLLVRTLAIPAATLRAGAVITPEFISRNVMRDQMVAFIYSATRPGRKFIPYKDFYQGWRELMKKGEVYEEYIKSGGPLAHLTAIDEIGARSSVRKIIQDGNLYTDIRNNVRTLPEFIRAVSRPAKREFRDMRDLGISKAGAKHLAQQPLRPLRTLTQVMENSTRLGEFKIMTEKARSEGREVTLSELQAAGMASREITLDFGRRGSKTMALNLISAFWNAKIQGIDKMARSLDPKNPEQAIAVMARMTATITLASALLHMHNRYDPDYWRIPEYKRLHFWNIKVSDPSGGEMWISKPKPFEQGVLWGSGAEYALEFMLEQDPHAADDLLSWVANTGSSLVPMPTGIVPVIDQIRGKDLFTDQPLVPLRRQGLLPEYQFTDYTLESTKAFGRFVSQLPVLQNTNLRTWSGLSPAVWENYAKDWTGGAGFYVLESMDKALREAGVVPDPPRADDTWADMPFFKGFLMRHGASVSRPVTDFFTKDNRNRPFLQTYQYLLNQGDVEAARVLWEVHGDKMATLDEIRSAIIGIGKFGRMIDQHPDIDGSEKRQVIDNAATLRAGIAETGLETYEVFEAVMRESMEIQRRQREEGELEGANMQRLIQEADGTVMPQEMEAR